MTACRRVMDDDMHACLITVRDVEGRVSEKQRGSEDRTGEDQEELPEDRAQEHPEIDGVGVFHRASYHGGKTEHALPAQPIKLLINYTTLFRKCQ